jgi:hypothetical protein
VIRDWDVCLLAVQGSLETKEAEFPRYGEDARGPHRKMNVKPLMKMDDHSLATC